MGIVGPSRASTDCIDTLDGALRARGTGVGLARSLPQVGQSGLPRRWRVVPRPNSGSIPTPHQRRRIHPRLAQESAAGSEKVCGTGRAGRAWEVGGCAS